MTTDLRDLGSNLDIIRANFSNSSLQMFLELIVPDDPLLYPDVLIMSLYSPIECGTGARLVLKTWDLILCICH